MEITFLGGADEVGASSTLIQMGGKTILVDAGIRISPRTSRGIANDQLPDLHPITLAGGPDYILLTHAHTDHTGALALVVEQYPHVPLLATRPTLDLTRILQADAQRIMTGKQEAEGELPIYDEIASERLMNAFQLVEFRQPVRLGEGLQVTYHPAGHIAGAATLVLESEEGTLVISGDVSLTNQRAVVNAAPPRIKADALILESTYGGKLQANRLSEENRIIESLRRVVERGGKALIPAFALGRAQEVLQILLAYRDKLDVPVYADGMVRAVCRAYTGFADWLPPNTVKAAGDEPLFFRDGLKPVDSTAQRDAILKADQPCIVVASSGMLTGGASVIYAKAWANDERNAIFLTGYQDEEAPGRFLQRMIKERQAGGEFTLKIDKESVNVRCDVDTYSLSAHADEMQLVTYAESMDADEIMLVHGDPAARHSLASALRQRGRRVHSPQIGQTLRFAFAKRPWAMGRVQEGHEQRPLNDAELWNALKTQAGSFYSARELAQMWWGDAERAREAVSALTNTLYFSPDWRQRDTFQVHTPEQVTRKQRQRAIMVANPDIVGKMVVLRDSNNRPRIGVVVNAGHEGFEASVYGTKGRHYPADVLLWIIGEAQNGIGEMLKQAKTLRDTLLPYERRLAIVTAAQPINPHDLIPSPLPDDISREQALLTVVMALAADGATLEPNGLLPRRAMQGEPLEQNAARDLAVASFPPEARLRKVGMEIHRKRLSLTFDFPARATELYAEQIDELADQTGWEVKVNPGVNQQSLGLAVNELLPEGGRVVKGVSFHMDKGEVHVEVEGVEDVRAFEKAYLDLTGFRLRVTRRGDSEERSGSPLSTQWGGDLGEGIGSRLEINAAYTVVRAALEPLGLYKVGLKGSELALTFISPQVAQRHTQQIAELAAQTGYRISVHPHPNQQQILQIATQIARDSGWQIRKGPGIHVDRAEVTFKLLNMPDNLEQAQANFFEQTGYSLMITLD